ncbi:MAG: tetratricopeptide repeat protein [Anaerolineales bacterium]|nr:tetratricopeptide repeat protein [Anaerolineales bacterium]
MLSLPVILLLEGCSYIVLFGAVSLLKREGLSSRFAFEALIFTLAVSGLTALTGIQTHPVLFLILIYLLTMRVRILVDLGNIFARRGQFELADKLYHLAAKFWPDATNRLILQVNQGTSLLQQKKLDEAIAIFNDVLEQAGQGYLGVKYEAATHYNLGVAYLRKNMDAKASIAFNAVIDTWPASLYARRAEVALEKHRRKNNPSTSKEDM